MKLSSTFSALLVITTHAYLANAACQKYVDAAKTAAKHLQSEYFKDGTYGDQAVWISAVDTFYLEQLDAVAGTKDYADVINTVYKGNEDYLDNGKSYDDVQWVVMSYLLAGNQERAKHFYDIASEARDDTCGGGCKNLGFDSLTMRISDLDLFLVWWSGDRNYKNSITNELYLATSGYLYDVTKEQKYLDNLKSTWKWIKQSGLRGSDGLFNDGLTEDCKNNGQTTWTYNQGVVLVGLGFLSKHAQDDSAVTDAFSIMDAAISKLTSDGALREPCESPDQMKCNEDQSTFKGILTYYMSWFLRISGKDDNGKYAKFVKTQADKVLANAQGSQGVFDNYWPVKDAPAAVSNAATQGAALGALVGAGNVTVTLNTHALINEVSDEKRFRKVVGGALYRVRDLVGDGLFTAFDHEPNWGAAHRLLMPAFNTLSVRGMIEDMRDICTQLLLKWERFGPEHIIDPVDDFTRVTYDTLAYCCLSYRLNSFYTEHPPAFSKAMSDFLAAAFVRTSRPALVQALHPSENAKYQADMQVMKDVAMKIVAERRANPTEKKDVLNVLLYGKDPQTGEGLSEETIINNMLTVIIAGHETSSGMLSFTTYYLLKNPHAMRKLQKEVDEVLGGRPMKPEDLDNMPYLIAVMRESLRLAPTATQRGVYSLEDTTLSNGKYFIKKGTLLVCAEWLNHRDPTVWGDDAEEFKPERMLDGKFETLPPNAWQPFGYGVRACIGRPFAWQEVALILASMVQRFDLEMADPSYNLILKQTITVKPKDFHIKARLRKTGPPLLALLTLAQHTSTPTDAAATQVTSDQPLYLLYGSNSGTSEAFAQRVANDAAKHGFKAKLDTMDSFTGALPTDGPIMIFTASYEGQPADNAARFVDWLVSLSGNVLHGVRFGVFGCGNTDWASTLQRIPRLCDDLLDKRGGIRILPRGEADSGKGDFFQVFEDFTDRLWTALEKEYAVHGKSTTLPSGLEVKTIDPGTGRAAALRQANGGLGKVAQNIILTKPGHPVKRHLEFELPEGSSYRSGDYLAILPRNPANVVRRVLASFGLSSEQEVVISSSGPTFLPIDKAISISDILSGYVELSQPATIHDLRTMVEHTTTDETRSTLQALIASYQEKVLNLRLSVLDIIETHHDTINLDLGTFLQMLAPMRIRQYSISSSPLWNPERATLTISVLESPLQSNSSKTFLGVGSNYLADLSPGDLVQLSVRRSANFQLPQDITVPIVALCAGSGLAPIRGFIQERAIQKASGRYVGNILLFFGCRTPQDDFIYSETELKDWINSGVVDVRPAFSRAPDVSLGCKYIQHRLWNDRADVVEAYRNRAQFYVCGSSQIAKEVKAVLLEIYKQLHSEKDDSVAKAELEALSKGRYATDVFE
ncbi:hypothetical protein VNI00_004153 [Paramarasmius palmivorus]|uniref:Cytochrome P450 n=1 Tax=Paramarasmius palmivorus TaxID=297713 RepID=A0AAW0DPP1_9AGAR